MIKLALISTLLLSVLSIEAWAERLNGKRKSVASWIDASEEALGEDSEDAVHNKRTLLSFLGRSLYARDEVINLIVNEYTAKPVNETVSVWLDSAIEAIKLSESDGEPVQIQGHDFLFVGSVGASRNQESLHKNGITHVINWSSSARCNLFEGIDYLCMTDVRGHDGMRRHLADLDKAVDFVESVRKSGGRVLSHCWYGKNRSVTLLVAYLMKYEGMGAAEANNLIKQTRPQAKPYWDSLKEYSRLLNYISRR